MSKRVADYLLSWIKHPRTQGTKRHNTENMMSLSNKRARTHHDGDSPRETKKPAKKKGVSFDQEEPRYFLFDPYNGHGAPDDEDNTAGGDNKAGQSSKLTEELTLLSTLHGKSRRELRDISKHDMKTVMKYGNKTKGNTVKGDQRWKFEFGNTVIITDNACKKEITCYKKAINIERAKITQAMIDNHQNPPPRFVI